MYRTRFAPSPIGKMHLGHARTALLTWLRARQQAGRIVMRIEDIDRYLRTQLAAHRERDVSAPEPLVRSLLDALEQGRSAADIYTVLTTAQAEIGRMWHAAQIGIAEEHFATATLQAALDDWERAAPCLQARYETLNRGGVRQAFAFEPRACASPSPPTWATCRRASSSSSTAARRCSSRATTTQICSTPDPILSFSRRESSARRDTA